MSETEETLSFLLGISSGWEDCAEFLKELSTKAWRNGVPKTAGEIWALSEEVERQAKEKRAYYDEKRAEADAEPEE